MRLRQSPPFLAELVSNVEFRPGAKSRAWSDRHHPSEAEALSLLEQGGLLFGPSLTPTTICRSHALSKDMAPPGFCS